MESLQINISLYISAAGQECLGDGSVAPAQLFSLSSGKHAEVEVLKIEFYRGPGSACCIMKTVKRGAKTVL